MYPLKEVYNSEGNGFAWSSIQRMLEVRLTILRVDEGKYYAD